MKKILVLAMTLLMFGFAAQAKGGHDRYDRKYKHSKQYKKSKYKKAKRDIYLYDGRHHNSFSHHSSFRKHRAAERRFEKRMAMKNKKHIKRLYRRGHYYHYR